MIRNKRKMPTVFSVILKDLTTEVMQEKQKEFKFERKTQVIPEDGSI
jgi:hypothetical protein